MLLMVIAMVKEKPWTKKSRVSWCWKCLADGGIVILSQNTNGIAKGYVEPLSVCKKDERMLNDSRTI